jgi:flagellar protein FlbT
MGLKITLKPSEKMIIGGAVITNGSGKTNLIIENKVPILRQKEILNEEDATTTARMIYFVIQLMYIDEDNIITYHNRYWRLVRKFLNAAPSQLPVVDQISELVFQQDYYRALKGAKKLMAYEKEVFENAQQSKNRLRENQQENHPRA